MSFHINNSNDIICDALYVVDSNKTLQNILNLIANGSGGGTSGITTLTGTGSALVTGTGSSRNIQVDLAGYLTTTLFDTLLDAKIYDELKLKDSNNVDRTLIPSITGSLTYNGSALVDLNYLTSQLSAKQDTLIAGNNITILNNTISSSGSGSGLVLQVDGVNQTATTLNFIQNNALLSGGVLNVSRLTHYDKIPLIYSTQSTIKDITQDSSSNLLWGTDILTTHTYLTSQLANKVNNSQVLTDVPANALFTDTLHPSNHPISMITGLQTALDTKQPILIAGDNITIAGGNTISASGASQSWVTANFLSPLNPGTIGVMQGLSSVMTANTWVISVDENTDKRNKFILKDGSNVERNLTVNQTGDLLVGGIVLATKSYTTTHLANKVNNSQVLTDVPANAVFTDTLYTHPTQHAISVITGLQAELDAKISQLNFVAPMTGSTTAPGVITIDSLLKPSSITGQNGISVLSSDSLGTVVVEYTGSGGGFSEQDIRDRIITNVNTLGTTAQSKLSITSNSATGVFIEVDSTEWATKQDLLTTYTENLSGNTYILNTDEANGVYAPWTAGYGSVVNTSTHSQISVGTSPSEFQYLTLTSTKTTGSYQVSIELQSGTTSHLVLAGTDTWSFTNTQSTNFTGLTSSWQTFTWTVNAYSNATLVVILGYPLNRNASYDSSVPYVQTAGTVKLRNFQIYTSGGVATSTISATTLLTSDITSSGTVQCVSLVQTSDEKIKENIENCDLDVIKKVFDNIEVKQYQRTDYQGNRIGFIAQDFVANLPEEYGNITHMTYDTGNPLWGLDYARVCCILWGTCKNQEERIKALETQTAKKSTAKTTTKKKS